VRLFSRLSVKVALSADAEHGIAKYLQLCFPTTKSLPFFCVGGSNTSAVHQSHKEKRKYTRVELLTISSVDHSLAVLARNHYYSSSFQISC